MPPLNKYSNNSLLARLALLLVLPCLERMRLRELDLGLVPLRLLLLCLLLCLFLLLQPLLLWSALLSLLLEAATLLLLLLLLRQPFLRL